MKEALLLAQQIALAQMHIELIGKVDPDFIQAAKERALEALMKAYES